jgi:hypothetical protein
MSIDLKKLLNTYDFQTILPGSKEKVSFKPITTGVMKKVLVYENEENIETLDNFLDDLISNCVISENFDINKLYLQDRFFLLVEIRKKSKGNMFKFNYKCPKCDVESIIAVDLSKLPVNDMKTETDIVKINDNISLVLKHLTRQNQKDAFAAISEDLPLNTRLAEIATYSYALAIDKVISGEEEDSNVPIEDKIYMLDSLDQDTYDNILNWFENNNFGLDFTYKFKCKNPDCKSEEKEINIPITNFFA